MPLFLRLFTRLGAALFAPLLLPHAVQALEEITQFGPNPGALRMHLHLPDNLSPGLPVVVALHGCTLDASRFDDETGLTRHADETPFLLLMPEQQTKNMGRRCFRWHDEGDNRPGTGESASIVAMIDHVLATHDADPARVYILGLSAGGAMSAVMLANHPDRFAGGAVIAGLPFDCNRPAGFFDFAWKWIHMNPFSPDGADATYACGLFGYPPTDRGPEAWASYVHDVSNEPDTWPLLSIWQGSGDATVHPDNLSELTDQWTAVQGIDQTADAEQTFGTATRRVYHDAQGTARVETWDLSGFPHAVPIDPDSGCGTHSDFMTDANLCAVHHIINFWGLTDTP